MVSIRYPTNPIGVDASGLERGLAALGEKIGQRRQEKKDLAEAEKIFGNMLGGGAASQGGDDFNKYSAWANGLGGGAMSLDKLDPRGGMTRAPLPDVPDNASLRVAAAHNVSDPMASYFQAIRSSESGGDDLAKNPNSSATGRYQFTEGTWGDLMRSNPELGLTAEGRTDPRQQESAVRAFTSNNARQLSRGGVKVDPSSLYAAHFLGAGGALNAYGQDDATPMGSVVSPEVIQANPFLSNMTVGDFKSWAGEKAGYAPRGGGAPSQQALENMAVGQSVPMPMAGGQADAGRHSATLPGGGSVATGFNLDPKTMAAAFANPYTRGLAAEIAKTRLAALADQRDPMKQIAYEKAVAELDQMRNPRPKMTDDMAEYLYSQKDPNFGQYQIDQKRAASTQVNVGAGEKAWDQESAKLFAKRYDDISASAGNATQMLGMYDLAEEALGTGVRTGFGAETELNLRQLGSALGIDTDPQQLVGGELIRAIQNRMALTMRSPDGGMGMPGALSDRDIKFLKDSQIGIDRSPQGNAQMLKAFRAMEQRKIELSQLADQYVQENGRLDAGFNQAVRQYAKANPLFPEKPTGSGATPGAGGATGRQRARNPETGETVEWDGTKWSPVR